MSIWDVIDSRNILLWVGVITLLLIAINNKVLSYIAVFLLSFNSIFESLHIISSKGIISISSLFVMGNTNYSEGMDFISEKLSFSVFLYVVAIIFLCFIAIKFILKNSFILNKKIRILFFVTPILFISFILIYYINNKLISLPMTASTYLTFIKEKSKLKNFIAKKNELLSNIKVISSNKKEMTLVLIIGESLTRRHMSLYDYTTHTTPKLDSIKNDGNLVIFNDVVSPYTHTIPSITTGLTSASIKSKFTKSYNIIDLANKANFETFWISNQIPLGTHDTAIGSINESANHTEFVNQV